MNGGSAAADDDLAEAAVQRADALSVLCEEAMTRAELVTALGVSRTTIHRTVRSLDERGLLAHEDGALGLSVLGEAVAAEAARYRRRVSAASHLQPFFETVPELPEALDVGAFEDARVTTTGPTNPYAPVGRFMALLRESGTLSGFDTTTVAPLFVDEIREEILGGMTTDVVYLPSVVDDIVAAYPDALAAAHDSGRLTLSTHEDLPFGLAIFDDRIGLGGYDPASGLLRVFVDTDDPAARDWALDLYESYRETADPVSLPQTEST